MSQSCHITGRSVVEASRLKTDGSSRFECRPSVLPRMRVVERARTWPSTADHARRGNRLPVTRYIQKNINAIIRIVLIVDNFRSFEIRRVSFMLGYKIHVSWLLDNALFTNVSHARNVYVCYNGYTHFSLRNFDFLVLIVNELK